MKNDAVVPCEDTARRVAELLEAGITLRQIADVSRLNTHDLRELPTQRKPVPQQVARAVELAWDHLLPIPTAITTRRIGELLDSGVTVRQIAKASGLSPHDVRGLRTRERRLTPYAERCVKTAWEALMLLPGPTVARVVELLDLGFAADVIADAAGLPTETVARLPERRGRIPFFVAAAIEQADVRLMGEADDPDEPDVILVERIVDGLHKGPLPVPERREAVSRLYAKGWSANAIARHLGIGDNTVGKDLDALGVERRSAA